MLMAGVNSRETVSGERKVDGNSSVHSVSDTPIFTGMCSRAFVLKVAGKEDG